MRRHAIWILTASILAVLSLAWLPLQGASQAPTAPAQGDSQIEQADTPPETDVTPDVDTGGNRPIESDQGGETPIGQNPPPVEPAEPWRVAVECAFTPEASATQCAFTGVPPAGEAGAVVFVVPLGVVCADVIGGQYAYVAPDAATGLNGYRPVGNAGWLTLDMAGVVTPAGAATYWFQSSTGIVPGTGPALACSPAPSPRATVAPTPSPIPTPATGTLAVNTLTCGDVPVDRDDYDWFGRCDPITYRLVPTGGQGESTTPAATVVDDLSPGTYDLEAMGFIWCHAVSDNVTADSNVVIEPGARTTVWIFLCDGD